MATLIGIWRHLLNAVAMPEGPRFIIIHSTINIRLWPEQLALDRRNKMDWDSLWRGGSRGANEQIDRVHKTHTTHQPFSYKVVEAVI